MLVVSGWSWLDDKRLNGWTISRCSICTSCFNSKQSCVHRSTNKNKIWLSCYNGWRKKIKFFYHFSLLHLCWVVKCETLLLSCRFIICLSKWAAFSSLFIHFYDILMLNNHTSWFFFLRLSLLTLLLELFCQLARHCLNMYFFFMAYVSLGGT